MKYLKHFESSDEDAEKLLKSLKDLSYNLDRLKSYAQYKNRERLHRQFDDDVTDDNYGKLLGEIGSEFEHYFYDLTDEGWTYYMNYEPTFYTRIELKNFLKKDGIEQEFENIVDRMSEIRDRMKDEGFKSKFMIFLNGKVQQDLNPNDYSLPLYKFSGLGDSYESYIREKGYDPNEYLFAKIEFAIV